MRRNPIFAVALALGLSTAACAPTTTAGAGFVQPGRQTSVEVTNHNWQQVVVYLEAGGMRHRLGTVNTGRTESFHLPASAHVGAGSVRLIADPIGSAQVYTTEPIPVRRGQAVEFTVENHLPISSYAVWTP
jgi:hypothetical protein